MLVPECRRHQALEERVQSARTVWLATNQCTVCLATNQRTVCLATNQRTVVRRQANVYPSVEQAWFYPHRPLALHERKGYER
jgi:hypothetical protein